ncbi:helix-turn-helix transcriptional regulator [Rheinheimera soli]|uniref:DNA-binding PadR family transcriptional regulator n=1 Tax=Rheinheimera soli TaxID=443616 RepID=A0ABU1W296_9GAMM|nr:helix-turn-helix transcriptional regulator [Rheinheimera soli]MDR7121838.1 DNA-binding PadR family transcriptional regulator [Rheinheimera soli]
MAQDKFIGELEQMVLLSVLQLKAEAYGTRIRQYLADTVDRDLSIGALYTTLERLEQKGLLTGRLGEATAERGGRAKKYFAVTAEGQQALIRSKQALDQLWQGLARQSGKQFNTTKDNSEILV